ncbi:hypothetical protein MBLNU459_g0135t1 [Dothideomycetes sp. NU459]
MSKILAVFGATGQQGRSVIDYVLNDSELSQKYRIRAITRDVASETSKQLKEKVEVVQGDVVDRSSLEKALTGVNIIFAMTLPSFGADSLETEYNSGKTIADVAVEKGVEYLIFSTLPPVNEISGGKFTKAVHFDAKVKIERYIQDLPVKSAFVSLGFFMQNFHSVPFLGPQKSSDGTWIITRHNSPRAKIPMVDVVGDTGKFVGAILAEPDKYEGKTFSAATALYSSEEAAAIISKVTGKTVVYKQISTEEFKNSLPFAGDIFAESFLYVEEFGYFGSESEKLVAWAAENARGKPNTLEEYVKANPFQLN